MIKNVGMMQNKKWWMMKNVGMFYDDGIKCTDADDAAKNAPVSHTRGFAPSGMQCNANMHSKAFLATACATCIAYAHKFLPLVTEEKYSNRKK